MNPEEMARKRVGKRLSRCIARLALGALAHHELDPEFSDCFLHAAPKVTSSLRCF